MHSYEYEYTLIRDDEESQESHVHMLLVDYGIEPAEYEGNHLFYAGGVYLNKVTDTAGNDFTLTEEEESSLLAEMNRKVFIPADYYSANY